jgi:outer membrane lipoprotein-sorting protein
MKKSLTIKLALSLMAALALSWPHTPGSVKADSTNPQAIVTTILDRMSQAVRTMQTLKASLSQQKFYAQLGIKDPVEQGVLYMRRKGAGNTYVRIEINVPDKRIITVKDNRYLFYQPKINQVVEGTVDRAAGKAAAGFLAYLFGGIAQAAEDYEITVVATEDIDGRKASHLKLTPKPDKKGLYRQVDLWVDNQLWLPTIQKFIESNRDETTLKLGEVNLNLNLSDSLFTQKLPSNVQRVKG